jgi:hypothetical protein
VDIADIRCSVYLLCWYKSAKTDVPFAGNRECVDAILAQMQQVRLLSDMSDSSFLSPAPAAASAVEEQQPLPLNSSSLCPAPAAASATAAAVEPNSTKLAGASDEAGDSSSLNMAGVAKREGGRERGGREGERGGGKEGGGTCDLNRLSMAEVAKTFDERATPSVKRLLVLLEEASEALKLVSLSLSLFLSLSLSLTHSLAGWLARFLFSSLFCLFCECDAASGCWKRPTSIEVGEACKRRVRGR